MLTIWFTELASQSWSYTCCVITHNEMQVAQSQRGLKTVQDLNHLESAYTAFQQTGHNLKKAKDHFNVISQHFLDIPLSQVHQTFSDTCHVHLIICTMLNRCAFLAYTSAWECFTSCLPCLRIRHINLTSSLQPPLATHVTNTRLSGTPFPSTLRYTRG